MFENDHPMGAQAFAQAHGQKAPEEESVIEGPDEVEARVNRGDSRYGFLDPNGAGRGYSRPSNYGSRRGSRDAAYGFEESEGDDSAPLFEG